MEGTGRTEAGEGNPMQDPADNVGFGPLYQNLVHTHYETPIHQANQHHERSESSQLDQNSIDSYGVNHVYANPSFSAYPEIPPPDYPLDNDGRQDHVHNRKHSSSSSSSSNSKVDHHSTPVTRRASSPTIQEAPSQPTGDDFHNVPLGLQHYECPRSDDTITVIAVPDDYSYWTYGIYSTIAFVSVIIVILIIWSLVYYGI